MTPEMLPKILQCRGRAPTTKDSLPKMSAVLRQTHLLWMVSDGFPRSDLHSCLRVWAQRLLTSCKRSKALMASQTHSAMRGREEINNRVKGRKQPQVLSGRCGSKRQMWTEASLPHVNEQGPLLLRASIASNGLMETHTTFE